MLATSAVKKSLCGTKPVSSSFSLQAYRSDGSAFRPACAELIVISAFALR